MTKKNKLGKKPVVVGAVATIITITIVFLLFPNILSEGIVTTKTNEELIKEGNEAGLLEVPFECIIESECEERQGFIGEPKDTNPIGEIIDPKPTNSTDVIPELVCDPPAELVDEQCLLPEPPLIEPPKVELISKVIKTDNTGEKFESIVNFEFQQLSFFVEDTSNLDFDNGIIENELFIKTDPLITVIGNGFFEIRIANQTIQTEPTPIKVSGITDENGQIRITFTSPLGSPSDLFTFQFVQNIDKFSTLGITEIQYVVSDFVLNIENFNFIIEEETIFQMNIARDPNQIIIVNEEGGTLRIFPTDDRIRLCSQTGKFCWKQCWQNSPTFGCQKYRTVCTTVGSPIIGAWKFIKFDADRNEILFEQGDSFTNSCPLDTIVQRNEIYKFQIGSPTKATIKWKAPMENESFLFSCTNSGTVFSALRTTVCNFRSQDNQAFINSLEIVP